MKTQIKVPRFDDLHVHFRIGEMLKMVLPHTAEYCGTAIAMPNLRPRAVLTAEDVTWYRSEIYKVLDDMDNKPDFVPLMTIEIRDSTTPGIIKKAKKAGAVAGKVYPLGVTTNSDAGLRDFRSTNIHDVFRAMEDEGMLLLLHGEIALPKSIVIEREHNFLNILEDLANKFLTLRMVLEHVSSAEGVKKVRELHDNVAATITAHHLCMTLDDVIGDGIRPHNGCMPMPKHYHDREALLAAATSGEAKFFLGSDSAPHERVNKECEKGACGVYTAPILPALLAQIFEQEGRLSLLQDFTSRFGAEFYGLPKNDKTITIAKEDWSVPDQYGRFMNIVPFKAGETLHWKLVKS